MADDARLKTLTPFLQQHGFVWGPEPEIYGGVAGFYTYGPNGTLLKRRVEQRIRNVFTRYNIFEVEVPTVLPRIVWEASGHLGGFSDPVVEDMNGNTYRADHLVAEHYTTHDITEPVPSTPEELATCITKHGIKAPDGTALKPGVRTHNLMMRTTVGLNTEAYNRPETATATYLPFLRYTEHFRKKLPFGVFQIGKAYRNEISPRQHLLRMREFTQAEAQIFVHPEQKDVFPWYADVQHETLPIFSWEAQHAGTSVERMTVAQARKKHFSSNAYASTVAIAYELYTAMGIPEERIRLRQHGPDEKAFYAADAWDVEIDLPTFGWYEVCGVHDRASYDLTQHATHSGKTLTVFTEEDQEHVVPHVLEIAFGVDRPVYALLDIFYQEKDVGDGKTALALPYALAPIHVAVLPLVKKLREPAIDIHQELLAQGIVATYDESGSIGKRYLRQNIIGTPFCVTVDFETLEGDTKGTVTVRDRDTEAQERVPVEQLVAWFRARL